MDKELKERIEDILFKLHLQHDKLELVKIAAQGEYAQAKIDTINDAMTDLESSIDNLTEVLGDCP